MADGKIEGGRHEGGQAGEEEGEGF